MPRFTEEQYKHVQELMRGTVSYEFSGFTSKFQGGKNVQVFQEQLRKYFGVKYAIVMNSGTTALILGMGALGMRDSKSYVSVPVYTFTACPASIMWWKPAYMRFVDINPQTLCMQYDPREGSDDMVLAVHTLGMPVDLEAIPSHIPVLEDCAQAFGTKYKGKMVGSIRDCAILSFQETKVLTTGGEGGAFLTNNDALAEKVANMRNHGEYYTTAPYACGNFRMTEYQAAWGIVQMENIELLLADLVSKAQYVIDHLPSAILSPVTTVPYRDSLRTYYILACTYMSGVAGMDRVQFLNGVSQRRAKYMPSDPSDIPGANNRPENGIIGAGYQKLMCDLPAYQHQSNWKNDFPIARDMLTKSLWLDIHRFRSLDDIKRDLDVMHDVLNGRKSV